MARPKNHIPGLAEQLQAYAESRMLELHQYSPYHFRLMDNGYVVFDIWSTGRYYIVMTDYVEMTDANIVERSGEKGNLPVSEIEQFIDKIFFPEGDTDVPE